MENWHMESFQREGMLHKLLLIDVDLKLLCPSMWTVSKAHILFNKQWKIHNFGRVVEVKVATFCIGCALEMFFQALGLFIT
jgi:hypothetical protein